MKNSLSVKQEEGTDLLTGIHLMAKQTSLSTCEVKMWVKHLSNVKRHRQEGAHKASSIKRKERSVDKSSRKSASLDLVESWCMIDPNSLK